MPVRKKPMRTLLVPPYPPRHFTRAQARRAVLAVMAERGETPREDPTATWGYEDDDLLPAAAPHA
jgi:hypothetical protein